MSLTRFTPKTLLDADRPTRLARTLRTRYGVRARCDCGQLRKAFCLIDVRHIDGIDQDFACDGCRTDWQRNLKPLHPDHKPVDKHDWHIEWCKQLGAPKVIVSKLVKIQKARVEKKRLNDLAVLEILDAKIEALKKNGAPDAVIDKMLEIKGRY